MRARGIWEAMRDTGENCGYECRDAGRDGPGKVQIPRRDRRREKASEDERP